MADLLAGYAEFSKDSRAASVFGTWKRHNPGESSKWDAFDKAILAGGNPTPPSLTTSYGQALVDAGKLYLDAAKPAPAPSPDPTPTPDPTPAPGGLDSRYPGALLALYGSYTPPAQPTKVITSATQLSALRLAAGDDVLVKAGSYNGQFNITGKLATGKIVARLRFERGVNLGAASGATCNLNIDHLGGVIVEGPAVATNPPWNSIVVNDCNDVVVRGLVAHDAATSGFYQGGDSGGSSNVWFVECEAYTNGHQSSCWNSYPPNYYLAGAHGLYYGGGGAQTRGGGIVGCYVHDQHVGYGVQFYGHTDGAFIDFCRFVNIDGKVSGADANLQTGTAGDRAGVGIEAWGSGVQHLTIGKNNTFQNCAYKDINVDGGAGVVSAA